MSSRFLLMASCKAVSPSESCPEGDARKEEEEAEKRRSRKGERLARNDIDNDDDSARGRARTLRT